MELCYEGGLVMPSSYAMMDEEEMTYVEGGKMSVNTAAKIINVGVTVILGAIGIGFGVGAILWFVENSVKGLVVSSLTRAITSVIASIGFSIGSSLYSTLSAINPNWSIGYGIAKLIDSRDSRPNNNVVFG